MGEEATYFATLGADVTAFDISEVGIRLTKERAEKNGVADRVHAMQMGAEETTKLPSKSFDLVHGLGILHHVDCDLAFKEVNRLLGRPSSWSQWGTPHPSRR